MMDEQKTKDTIAKLEFNCKKCSNCCRHEPGAVFLTDEDFIKIREYLKVDVETLLRRYCRGLERSDGVVVALKEKDNFDCIFWDQGCTIYPARPLQCRTFPFWPALVESSSNWKDEKYRCKGIDEKGSMTFDEKYTFYVLEKESKYMVMPKR
jgi:Fe-S-cluster containining protein